MKWMRNFLKSKWGQGMTEYIIIVAIISVAAIGLSIVFRKQIQNYFKYVLSRLKGEQAEIKKEAFSDSDRESPFGDGKPNR